METATLGGGCFWCLDAALRQLEGIRTIECGYAGGKTHAPEYRDICEGDTNHAEVVRIEFDPECISYRDLLSAFFLVHDPTTLNRQGMDAGTQYRSVIFTHSEAQTTAAQELIGELNTAAAWPDPIVTAVLPAPTFWPAESYHQDYFAKNPMQPYCQAVVAPKVAKLRKALYARLKQSP